MFNCTRRVCGLFDRARNAVSRGIEALKWEAPHDVASFNFKVFRPILYAISWCDYYPHSFVTAMYAELEAQASDMTEPRIHLFRSARVR